MSIIRLKKSRFAVFGTGKTRAIRTGPRAYPDLQPGRSQCQRRKCGEADGFVHGSLGWRPEQTGFGVIARGPHGGLCHDPGARRDARGRLQSQGLLRCQHLEWQSHPDHFPEHPRQRLLLIVLLIYL